MGVPELANVTFLGGAHAYYQYKGHRIRAPTFQHVAHASYKERALNGSSRAPEIVSCYLSQVHYQ